MGAEPAVLRTVTASAAQGGDVALAKASFVQELSHVESVKEIEDDRPDVGSAPLGDRGGRADSLLCGDIRTEQGASIVRRHGRRKVIADNDIRDTIIMVTAGH
jgi:hypothetical protein